MTDILDELDEAWVAAGKPTGVLPRRKLFAAAAAEIRKLRDERSAIVEERDALAEAVRFYAKDSNEARTDLIRSLSKGGTDAG